VNAHRNMDSIFAADHPSSAESVAGVERADDHFFAALLAADVAGLDALLAQDFLLVDVVGGAVIDRAAFVATIGSGLLRFDTIRVVERSTRRYGDTAVVVGRTQMAGSVEGTPFEAASRYTHVLARGADRGWLLINAQGTRIVDQQEHPSET
jgi:ketosteroid isomerase-like protein